MFNDITLPTLEDVRGFVNQISDRQIIFQNFEKIQELTAKTQEYEDILQPVDLALLMSVLKEYSSQVRNTIGISSPKPQNLSRLQKLGGDCIVAFEVVNLRYAHFKIFLAKKIQEGVDQLTETTKEFTDKITTLTENHDLATKELNEKISTQNTDIDTLQKVNKKLREDLQTLELNKLANAFSEAENQYSKGSKIPVYLGFFFLLLPGLFSICLALSKIIVNNHIAEYINTATIDIYTFAPFVVVSIILWYLQYFQLKNYYINKDLETNFANRKAVANSFKGLLDMVHEEGSTISNGPELISKFIEKASTILYADIDSSYTKKHSDNIPSTQLLDLMTEILKKVNKT